MNFIQKSALFAAFAVLTGLLCLCSNSVKIINYSKNPQEDFRTKAITNIKINKDSEKFLLETHPYKYKDSDGKEGLAKTSLSVTFVKSDPQKGVDGYCPKDLEIKTECFSPDGKHNFYTGKFSVKNSPYGIQAKGSPTTVITPYGRIVRSDISMRNGNTYGGTKYDFKTNEFVFAFYIAFKYENGGMANAMGTNRFEDAALNPDVSNIRPENFKRGKMVYFRWKPEGRVDRNALKFLKKCFLNEYKTAKADNLSFSTP